MLWKKKTPMPSSNVLEGLPRGNGLNGTLPGAVWENPRNILSNPELQFNAENGDILLGSLSGNLIGVNDNRHLITFAGNRSGKSLTLVANLLFYLGSTFILDCKAELAAICALFRSEVLGQKVGLLDPFNIAPSWVSHLKCSLNPLSIIKKNLAKAIENAALIADGLVTVTTHGDPHWDLSAKKVIKFVILHIVTFPKYAKDCHLLTLKRLLTVGPDGRSGFQGLIQEMKSNTALNYAIAMAGRELEAKQSKELDYILSSAHTHLEFLEFPSMENVLINNDLDLSELKTYPKGMTLIPCLPAGRLPTCNRWLRSIMNLALETMESTRVREGGRLDETATGHPTLFILDEFAAGLGYMQQIESAAGQMAGFGTKLWPILQDITQLKALYKERWETFIGNAGTIQFFANTDISTLEYFSKLLGTTSVVVENKNNPTFEQKTHGQVGLSYNVQTTNLLTPAEAALIFSRDDPMRRQCIIRAGCKPMIIQRVKYFDKSLPEYVHFEGKYKEFI